MSYLVERTMNVNGVTKLRGSTLDDATVEQSPALMAAVRQRKLTKQAVYNPVMVPPTRQIGIERYRESHVATPSELVGIRMAPNPYTVADDGQPMGEQAQGAFSSAAPAQSAENELGSARSQPGSAGEDGGVGAEATPQGDPPGAFADTPPANATVANSTAPTAAPATPTPEAAPKPATRRKS